MTETASAAEDGTAARPVPFISRVRIKNYKSIASCDVRLGPLTILVGPNGSGKSNFLDALAFMARALETTPEEAINERGGLDEILRRVPDEARSFSIAIDATVPWGPRAYQQVVATYEFEIGLPPPRERRLSRPFDVVHEKCSLDWNSQMLEFEATRGDVTVKSPGVPTAKVKFEADRLYSQIASADVLYAPLFTRLRRMLFYNFSTETLRRPQPSAARPLLQHDGEALGDVLAALARDNPASKARLDAYVGAIVQDAVAVEAYRAGGYMTVALKTDVQGEDYEFSSIAMSDGTIRAVAMLAALFQPEALDGRLPLVGIEEPETALHPAAAGVLFDALTEASSRLQVIATSQSPDLLDREDLDPSIVRVAAMRDGLTVIGEVDAVSREIVARRLYTLGALMRGNQLAPEQPDGGVAAG